MTIEIEDGSSRSDVAASGLQATGGAMQSQNHDETTSEDPDDEVDGLALDPITINDVRRHEHAPDLSTPSPEPMENVGHPKLRRTGVLLKPDGLFSRDLLNRLGLMESFLLRLDDEAEATAGIPPHPPMGQHKYFSVVMGIAQNKEYQERKNRILKTREMWKRAFQRVRTMSDPWEKFALDTYPTETCKRHRYSALRKTWVCDTVHVKMEPKPFNAGAMRECYRMKKLSNFSGMKNWCRDSNNYVMKKYIKEVERDTYFDDVKLQMDAKLWGEEYNRHNPPKKVDIVQMAVLEFENRPGKPLYHVEHFIEGNYVKYNSNSGFVKDDTLRTTPQAFSHFTFERSGHELIVVDIQGVGDLYTDPQIHTAIGTDYNEGNLGTRGMALFFHSHVCNDICESLGLSKFDIAPTEEEDMEYMFHKIKGATLSRGSEELCLTPSRYERTHWHEFLRMRSSSSGHFSDYSSSPPDSPHVTWEDMDMDEDEDHDLGRQDSGFSHDFPEVPIRRRRYTSESSATMTDENDRMMFSMRLDRISRPACVEAEKELRRLREDQTHKTGGSVLGGIHFDLAKYHELKRFTSTDADDYDHKAAFFHLQHAADLGVLEAIITMARIYFSLPHDVLPDLEAPNGQHHQDYGMDYMLQAAEAGDRAAMVFCAQAYDAGENLGVSRKRNWEEAIYWYDRAVRMDSQDEEGNFDGTMEHPTYKLVARQAEMFIEGKFGLQRDPQRAGDLYTEAAEAAMADMKGRLANKFFMLAEEAWGECEE